MKTILLSLTLLLSMGAFADSPTRGTKVAAFDITGIDGQDGKNISVYYVSGREAFLGTNWQRLKVNKVFKVVTLPISANQVTVPATVVPKDGFRTFNYVLTVVHGQKLHSLRNIDGSVPDYLNAGDVINTTPDTLAFVDKAFKKSKDLTNDPVITFE